MPNIDQAKDTYNPPGTGPNDFEETLFGDIDVDDLFWLKTSGADNPAYRKTADNQAGNTRERTLHNFGPRDTIFQRI